MKYFLAVETTKNHENQASLHKITITTLSIAGHRSVISKNIHLFFATNNVSKPAFTCTKSIMETQE